MATNKCKITIDIAWWFMWLYLPGLVAIVRTMDLMGIECECLRHRQERWHASTKVLNAATRVTLGGMIKNREQAIGVRQARRLTLMD